MDAAVAFGVALAKGLAYPERLMSEEELVTTLAGPVPRSRLVIAETREPCACGESVTTTYTLDGYGWSARTSASKWTREYSSPGNPANYERSGIHIAPTQAMCNSFKTEVLTGTHNFTAGTGDTFNLALYTSTWTGSKATTAYSATNEVGNSGTYAAGGGALTSVTPVLDGDTAICDFSPDLAFTGATITARGALIYNASKTNKAVCVLDFTTDKTSTAGTFTIAFPAAAAATAIIRLA